MESLFVNMFFFLSVMLGAHWVTIWHCYLWLFVALYDTGQKCSHWRLI